MSITDADITKAAASLGLLGNGPQAAHQVLAALCDPALDVGQLTALIAREPGLAARVLKVANSAYYGHSRHIATLDRALVVLGLDAVRGITAAACLDRSLLRRSHAAGAEPRSLINHCVASAFAAEQLAKRSGRGSSSEAFMAALLHDFGVPAQELLDPLGVAALVEALRRPDTDATQLEKELVQVGHAHCARVVFEDWHLPESIVQAALHHDDPSQAPPAARELTTLVHMGIRLAIDAGFTYPLEPRRHRVAATPLLEFLGVDAKAAAEIAEALPERVLLLAENAA